MKDVTSFIIVTIASVIVTCCCGKSSGCYQAQQGVKLPGVSVTSVIHLDDKDRDGIWTPHACILLLQGLLQQVQQGIQCFLPPFNI